MRIPTNCHEPIECDGQRKVLRTSKGLEGQRGRTPPVNGIIVTVSACDDRWQEGPAHESTFCPLLGTSNHPISELSNLCSYTNTDREDMQAYRGTQIETSLWGLAFEIYERLNLLDFANEGMVHSPPESRPLSKSSQGLRDITHRSRTSLS